MSTASEVPAGSLVSCGNIAFGDGEIAAMIDARTLRLTDGREIRLKGLAPFTPGGTSSPGLALTRTLLQIGQVRLRGTDPTPDRYGRQTAIVTPATGTIPLQITLLETGLAAASGADTPDCNAELLRAEAVAQSARRDIWTNPAAIKNAENTADILAELGRFVIVEGKIHSVRQAGSTVYVNFGRRWTRDFTVVMPRKSLPLFEGAGLKVRDLSGRGIRARGIVEQRGGPRIQVRHVGQIQLLDAPALDAVSSETSRRQGSGQAEN